MSGTQDNLESNKEKRPAPPKPPNNPMVFSASDYEASRVQEFPFPPEDFQLFDTILDQLKGGFSKGALNNEDQARLGRVALRLLWDAKQSMPATEANKREHPETKRKTLLKQINSYELPQSPQDFSQAQAFCKAALSRLDQWRSSSKGQSPFQESDPEFLAFAARQMGVEFDPLPMEEYGKLAAGEAEKQALGAEIAQDYRSKVYSAYQVLESAAVAEKKAQPPLEAMIDVIRGIKASPPTPPGVLTPTRVHDQARGRMKITDHPDHLFCRSGKEGNDLTLAVLERAYENAVAAQKLPPEHQARKLTLQQALLEKPDTFTERQREEILSHMFTQELYPGHTFETLDAAQAATVSLYVNTATQAVIESKRVKKKEFFPGILKEAFFLKRLDIEEPSLVTTGFKTSAKSPTLGEIDHFLDLLQFVEIEISRFPKASGSGHPSTVYAHEFWGTLKEGDKTSLVKFINDELKDEGRYKAAFTTMWDTLKNNNPDLAKEGNERALWRATLTELAKMRVDEISQLAGYEMTGNPPVLGPAPAPRAAELQREVLAKHPFAAENRYTLFNKEDTKALSQGLVEAKKETAEQSLEAFKQALAKRISVEKAEELIDAYKGALTYKEYCLLLGRGGATEVSIGGGRPPQTCLSREEVTEAFVQRVASMSPRDIDAYIIKLQKEAVRQKKIDDKQGLSRQITTEQDAAARKDAMNTLVPLTGGSLKEAIRGEELGWVKKKVNAFCDTFFIRTPFREKGNQDLFGPPVPGNPSVPLYSMASPNKMASYGACFEAAGGTYVIRPVKNAEGKPTDRSFIGLVIKGDIPEKPGEFAKSFKKRISALVAFTLASTAPGENFFTMTGKAGYDPICFKAFVKELLRQRPDAEIDTSAYTYRRTDSTGKLIEKTMTEQQKIDAVIEARRQLLEEQNTAMKDEQHLEALRAPAAPERSRHPEPTSAEQYAFEKLSPESGPDVLDNPTYGIYEKKFSGSDADTESIKTYGTEDDDSVLEFGDEARERAGVIENDGYGPVSGDDGSVAGSEDFYSEDENDNDNGDGSLLAGIAASVSSGFKPRPGQARPPSLDGLPANLFTNRQASSAQDQDGIPERVDIVNPAYEPFTAADARARAEAEQRDRAESPYHVYATIPEVTSRGNGDGDASSVTFDAQNYAVPKPVQHDSYSLYAEVDPAADGTGSDRQSMDFPVTGEIRAQTEAVFEGLGDQNDGLNTQAMYSSVIVDTSAVSDEDGGPASRSSSVSVMDFDRLAEELGDGDDSASPESPPSSDEVQMSEPARAESSMQDFVAGDSQDQVAFAQAQFGQEQEQKSPDVSASNSDDSFAQTNAASGQSLQQKSKGGLFAGFKDLFGRNRKKEKEKADQIAMNPVRKGAQVKPAAGDSVNETPF